VKANGHTKDSSIRGRGTIKLFLLVKGKYTIGNKYFLFKWGGHTLCG